jgi:type I restriction enzyme M protein
LVALGESRAWKKWDADQAPEEVFAQVLGATYSSEKACLDGLKALALRDIPGPVIKEMVKHAAVADSGAPLVKDRKGNPVPDPDLRDNEHIPLGEDADAYVKREFHPYVPEAWVDHSKTKIGYEIPLTRHFYVYKPPRSVAELNAEIAEHEARIQELLEGLL